MFSTLPMIMTWTRIVAIPLILLVFYLPISLPVANLVATVMCVVFALTDWLDGYLARAQGLVSPLGRVLDPLVDKVLISGAFIFLLPVALSQGENWLPPWMVAVVVGRELIITSVREVVERHGVAFGADWPGKLKMVLQCAAICLALVAEEVRPRDSLWGIDRALWNGLRDLSMWAMALATVASGGHYLAKLGSIRWGGEPVGTGDSK